MVEYTKIEFLTACASRHVRDGEHVFGGTGLPLLAALLAKETHAPKSNLISEAGFIDARPRNVPLSVADSRYYYGASASIGLIETLGFLLQGGRIDVGFLGAAQIDEYGNLNTTYIGSFEKPKVKLPGSGGGNDIASSAKRLIIMMTHDKRKFVKKLDYFTSPGHIDGPGSREKWNLVGGGPEVVITDMCQMDFEPQTLKIRLMSVHPGYSVQDVVDNVMFDLLIPDEVPTTEIPTQEQIDIMQNLDPNGIYLGKGGG
ncbi:MAG: 3-oxoadipate CoA-transferase subunit B [Candidatus Thorarchaeota archaeon]|nr:MAG: 3-oxoadipate CoA-transferase subunit B [Candidatus Thorarchaeota archaeon]